MIIIDYMDPHTTAQEIIEAALVEAEVDHTAGIAVPDSTYQALFTVIQIDPDLYHLTDFLLETEDGTVAAISEDTSDDSYSYEDLLSVISYRLSMVTD